MKVGPGSMGCCLTAPIDVPNPGLERCQKCNMYHQNVLLKTSKIIYHHIRFPTSGALATVKLHATDASFNHMIMTSHDIT